MYRFLIFAPLLSLYRGPAMVMSGYTVKLITLFLVKLYKVVSQYFVHIPLLITNTTLLEPLEGGE